MTKDVKNIDIVLAIRALYRAMSVHVDYSVLERLDRLVEDLDWDNVIAHDDVYYDRLYSEEFPKQVTIEVYGGVAYVAQAPEDVEVIILDYDNCAECGGVGCARCDAPSSR